jgi:hypothetical protein
MPRQYRSSDGKPLYHSTGTNIDKIMSECCCNSPCTCDPPLKRSYTITFSGMTGIFAVFNGTPYTVNNLLDSGNECEWRSPLIPLSGGGVRYCHLGRRYNIPRWPMQWVWFAYTAYVDSHISETINFIRATGSDLCHPTGVIPIDLNSGDSWKYPDSTCVIS